jgi:acyl-coenzyme A synthetase/AMP-(fatty) acid ligase
VLLPLYVGAPLVLAPPDAEAFAQTIEREQVGYAFHDLEAAAAITREARRAVRRARGTLEGILLSTPGVFDPGDRQRVGRAFECPALTVFGLPETGVIFASHQSWYLEESVGIPVSNMHVVPADPRTGAPIQALWELVESAEVTVRGPTLMCGDESPDHAARFVDGLFRTGVIASSDANGMIYLLPD